jgi:L-iditol 2-dehydrogenase
MKTVVLTGIRQMEMREAPKPEIGKDTDVLLKVESVGVCGSDVHYYVSGRIGGQVVSYPFRVGHEFAATVTAVGRKVKRVKVGDRVAVEPAMSCGKCDQCRSGRRHTCRKLRFLGCPGQAEGCLAEYVVMPQECCYPVKKKTTFDQAALAEPLSIGIYAVRLAAPLKIERMAILGSGCIGLSVLLAARNQGIKKIYVTDRIDVRLAAARKAGATWTGNPYGEDVVSAISEREPLLLDAVFECCGQQEALDQAVRMLKPGGKLLIVGIPETERISFPIDTIRHREICIQNVRRQNECVQPAVDLIEGGKIKVDFMVTHRFPLERAKEAFELVANYRDGVVKAMINL